MGCPCSRRQHRLGVLSLDSATSATAAFRARFGHSPPAASATASNASHTSASRSSTPGRHLGPHTATLVPRSSPCRHPVTQRVPVREGHAPPERLDASHGCARRMRTTTDRVRMVSGRWPSPAIATAQYAGNSTVSTLLPLTTHRPATAPPRWPALISPRTSSCSRLSDRRRYRSRQRGSSAARGSSTLRKM